MKKLLVLVLLGLLLTACAAQVEAPPNTEVDVVVYKSPT